jgi:transformation/transcription domain-associated protein
MASATSCALAFEQAGMWSEAQQMYEHCQFAAQKRTINRPEGEYVLWEDRWVRCAEKLQQVCL